MFEILIFSSAFCTVAGLAIEGNTKESEPHVIKQTGKVANLEEQIRGIVSVRLCLYTCLSAFPSVSISVRAKWPT